MIRVLVLCHSEWVMFDKFESALIISTFLHKVRTCNLKYTGYGQNAATSMTGAYILKTRCVCKVTLELRRCTFSLRHTLHIVTVHCYSFKEAFFFHLASRISRFLLELVF